jgi:hypothetical protein
MPSTQPFDPAAASGESNYRGSQGLTLNEVSINGDAEAVETPPGSGKFVRKGGYFRKRILIGAPKDEKPEEMRLEAPVRLIFLKIRRKLVERGDKGKILRATGEHNTKYDAVTLYAEGKPVEDGVASDLREKYSNLRTIQVVYALLLGTNEPELVRFIARGSSLGSESKAETTTDFYRYLGSYGKDEHVYEYETIVEPVLEQGLKAYYAIDFKRGAKVDEHTYALAMQHLKAVHEKCVEQDTARAAKIAKAGTVPADDVVPDAEASGLQYPTDDINPDDIPF